MYMSNDHTLFVSYTSIKPEDEEQIKNKKQKAEKVIKFSTCNSLTILLCLIS